MSITLTGASTESAPTGDAGADSTDFLQNVKPEYLCRLTLVGGSDSVFELWGRRDSTWGILLELLDGDTIPTNTVRFFTLEDLRFFDRLATRCTSGGPTSYELLIEEERADG